MANLSIIKRLAEDRNITIKSLAQQVGVTEQQIHVMVKTNSTKVSTLEKIASVLEVSPLVFFDDKWSIIEEYKASGSHAIAAKNIRDIDNRTFGCNHRDENSEGNPEGVDSKSMLKLEIEYLHKQVAEKDDRIQELKEYIKDLKDLKAK